MSMPRYTIELVQKKSGRRLLAISHDRFEDALRTFTHEIEAVEWKGCGRLFVQAHNHLKDGRTTIKAKAARSSRRAWKRWRSSREEYARTLWGGGPG